MNKIAKIKTWINEHAPTLAVLYENKYIGMAYDRFASLPPSQQRQSLVGIAGLFVFFIFTFLGVSYYRLWSYSSGGSNAEQMAAQLAQYQKHLQSMAGEIQLLERNNRLAAPGAFKQHLISLVRLSNISPRMATIEEMEGPSADTESKESGAIRSKQASIKLQKLNLAQLTDFIQKIEGGSHSLSISQLKIQNDENLRGYMNVEMGVVTYLFDSQVEG